MAELGEAGRVGGQRQPGGSDTAWGRCQSRWMMTEQGTMTEQGDNDRAENKGVITEQGDNDRVRGWY